MVEKCRQSYGFIVIDAVVERVEAFVDNLMLLVGEEERTVALDLGAVGYLRQYGAQLGEVVEERLLLGQLGLSAPILVKLVGNEIEIWQLVTTVFLGDHSAHFNKGGGGIDAGLFQLNWDDDGISLEDKWKQALKGKTARCVDDKVKVLVAHGSDKILCITFAAELGTGHDLIEGLELGPALTVLLVFLDDAALRVTVERDETAVVFEDKLVGEQYTNGGLAASAFLVSGYDNLVALLRGGFPDVEKWYVHKVGYR